MLFFYFFFYSQPITICSSHREKWLSPIAYCTFFFFLLISSTTVAPEALDTMQAQGYNHSITVICLVAHYRTCCHVQNLNIPIFSKVECTHESVGRNSGFKSSINTQIFAASTHYLCAENPVILVDCHSRPSRLFFNLVFFSPCILPQNTEVGNICFWMRTSHFYFRQIICGICVFCLFCKEETVGVVQK